MCDQFLHGEPAQIALCGFLPIRDSPLILPRALELLRDHFRRRFDDVGETLLQHQRDRGMKLLPPRPQHGRIGGVLDERVLEGIGRVRRRTAQKNQFRFGQADQRVLQHRVRQAGDGGQDSIGKIASDGRADLQHLARGTEPVDPRHQRGLQRRRNRQVLCRLIEHVVIAGFVQSLALEHRLGQLFDEQRHAVGALDDLIEQSGRQFLSAGYMIDQHGPLALRQPVERQHGDVRLPGPGRLKFRTEGDDEKDRQGLQALDGQRQQFERRWIGPMHVLEQHQHRPAPRQRLQLLDQRRENLAPPGLRVSLGRLQGGGRGQSQKLGEQLALHRAASRVRCQQLFKLRAFGRRIVVVGEARGVRKLRQNRLQRTALMMRLAEVAQAGMRIVLDVIFQRRGQARLADARLPRQQHHAAFAFFDLLPAPPQQLDFLFAADERGLGRGAERLEAARDGALAQHAPGADRLLEAFELRRFDGLRIRTGRRRGGAWWRRRRRCSAPPPIAAARRGSAFRRRRCAPAPHRRRRARRQPPGRWRGRCAPRGECRRRSIGRRHRPARARRAPHSRRRFRSPRDSRNRPARRRPYIWRHNRQSA